MLEVPMDAPLLVRVLNTLAHLHEQTQPFLSREPDAIAVRGDGLALDVFHRKVWTTVRCRAPVEDRRDRRVIHHGKGLTFGVEPGEHVLTVHPLPNQLDGHLPPDRLQLVREPDFAHSTLAYPLEKAVRPDGRCGDPAALGGHVADQVSERGAGLTDVHGALLALRRTRRNQSNRRGILNRL
jgi:hypothetical protein